MGNAGSSMETSDVNYVVPAAVANVFLIGKTPQTVAANNLGDTITSNDAGSTLIGGSGNDTPIAGHGHDTLTGAAGADTFVFKLIPRNAGQITNFTVGTNHINLSCALAATPAPIPSPVAGSAPGRLRFRRGVRACGEPQVLLRERASLRASASQSI